MQTKQKISAYRLTEIHLHLNGWASPVIQIRWSLLAEKDKFIFFSNLENNNIGNE